MAKNNQIAKGSIVAKISTKLNKHGEIRGKNKKETQNLISMCPGNAINKKGKLKAKIHNDGNGTCTCEMCTRKFPSELYAKSKVKHMVKDFDALLHQARFMVVSADLGRETEEYLARLSVDIDHLPKVYGKIKHAVEKRESIRNKKKGNKRNNRGTGSESYGAWR